MVKRFIKRKVVLAGIAVILAVVLVASGVTVSEKVGPLGLLDIGVGQKVFTIGTEVYAAGTADYTCTGTNDDVVFQQALDALPSGGGKLAVLAGSYSFSATVTRAIDNVTIRGVGPATSFSYNGSDYIFTAGGNNWVFGDFKTDAGGLNMGLTTGWSWENVTINVTLYAYRTASDLIPSLTSTPSQGDVLYYNGTDWVALSPGTSGEYLETQGASANPQWSAVSALPSGTQGDILYYNGSDWVVLGAGTDGYYLKTQGASANPLWAAVNALPSGTQGDIVYYNGSAWVVLAAGTAGQVLKTGGAGANPSWTAGLPSSPSTGDLLYWNGTAWTSIAIGTLGQVLEVGAGSTPTWDDPSGGSATRTATKVVAASDATADEKAAADALCDGSSDETEINAALAADTRIVLSSGTFTIDGTITAAVADVTLEGQGRGTTIFLANASDCDVITVGGDGWAIKNLKIDGNRTNQTANRCHGIFASDKDDGLIENIYAVNCGYASLAGAFTFRLCNYWEISFCEVYNSGHYGIQLWGASMGGANYHFQIENCIVRDGAVDDGFLIDGGRDIKLANCLASGNSYANFNIGESDAAYSVSLVNCHSEYAVEGSGFRIKQSHYCTMTGCTSYEDGTAVATIDGILISAGSHCTITGCTVYHPHDKCISIEGAATHIAITGNTFRDCDAEHAIEISGGCSGITINGNIIEESRTGASLKMLYGILIATGNRIFCIDNTIDGVSTAGIIKNATAGGDDCVYRGNHIYGHTSMIGIHLDDGDDCIISDNRLQVATPIDVNNANVVRPMIMGNNWEGCTNDTSYAAATTPKFQNNIGKNGNWWGTTTKTEFFQATSGYDSGTRGSLSYYSCVTLVDGAADANWQTFRVPEDFVSFVKVEAVWVCSAAAGNMYWEIRGDYGASGEAYNSNTETPGVGVTATGGANEINVQEPANPITLSGLAKDDYVGLRVYRGGNDANDTLDADVYLLGILFTYIGEDTSTK